MTKKAIRGLIILCAVLLVLALVLAAVVLIPKLTGEKASGTETSLCALTDITGLDYTCGDRVYHFEQKDGTWTCPELPDYPIVQNRLSRLCSALTALKADRTFEAAGDLSEYGLSPAATGVTATDGKGGVFTLQTGSSCGDSGVYALAGSVDGICVVNSTITAYLSYTLLDLTDAGSTPAVTEADQTGLTLEQGGKSVRFTQSEGSWYLELADGSLVKEEDISAIGPDGENHTLRKYLNDMSEQLDSMKTSRLCAYDCSDEELAGYGLDSPLVITFTAGDGRQTVYRLGNSISGSEGTGLRPLTTPGSKGVYLVPQADCWTTLFDLFAQ